MFYFFGKIFPQLPAGAILDEGITPAGQGQERMVAQERLPWEGYPFLGNQHENLYIIVCSFINRTISPVNFSLPFMNSA